MKTSNRQFRIGEVYGVAFGGNKNEQRGYRPGLVFQNNVGNTYSPNLIVLPLTSVVKKVDQPTHVIIPSDSCGLLKDSIVLCENPQCVSKDRVGKYITTIPDKYMSEVAAGSLIASSAVSFLDPISLLAVWQKAVSLNS